MTVTVRYRMASTYTKTVDLDQLAGTGAPIDDLDALASWLQDNPDRTTAADLTMTDNWVDTDPGSVEVDSIEAS